MTKTFEFCLGMQETLGHLNGGSVYAVYDYNAQHDDELSFKCGELLRVSENLAESENLGISLIHIICRPSYVVHETKRLCD